MSLKLLSLAALLLLPLGVSGATLDADEVIVPGATPKSATAPADRVGSGMFTFTAVVLLAGAGAWLLWRGRGRNVLGGPRAARNLQVEETRGLGGRQYLVVASYRDQKFLLGVCPGRIDLLSPLADDAPVFEKGGE